METLRFERYCGLGKDYLVYDCSRNAVQLDAEMVRYICERHYGIEAAGIFAGPIWGKTVWKKGIVAEQCFGLTIWNADGSQAGTCAQSAWIFAVYLRDAGYIAGDHCTLETAGEPCRIAFAPDASDVSGGNVRRIGTMLLTPNFFHR